MKKVALFILCSIILIGGASAFIVSLSAPKTIPVGEILYVNGTSNLPPGFSTEVALSRLKTSGYILKIPITIQGDGSFAFSVDTHSLKEGTYRLEVIEKNEFPYGTGSTEWLFFEVIDRRDELTVTSPLTQDFDGTLEIAGSVSTIEDKGLKVEVRKGSTTVYGPEYIATTKNGGFSLQVPIDSGGTYTVTLVDSTEYPWIIQYTVLSPTPTTAVPTTILPTPAPTTGAPVGPHATAVASRTQPAYFEVSTYPGEAHAVTSAGVDWVIEYADETGTVNKVNNRGTAAEEVRFASSGGTVYFKVYPDQFADQAPVTLTVENARSVSTCTTCQAVFGDVVTTPAVSLPLILVLGALAVLIIAKRRS